MKRSQPSSTSRGEPERRSLLVFSASQALGAFIESRS